MTTIIIGFGKFRYNHLPMGMCASVNIFQSKVNKLLGDIKGVQTYINDIIVLNKDCFKNYMEQLRIIFSRLRVEGLKYNAPKCSFGLNYIPYLGYAITREGIKTDPMKSQGIMDLGQPKITT